MKLQFSGALDADGAADEFILAYLARHKGGSVTADQVWKSLRSRGLVLSDGSPTAPNDPDEGAAIAEISRRLEKWLAEGLVGGDQEPESITGVRHFWVLGHPQTKG
ncbi:MAG: hypothetical protein ABSA15_03740 [Thermoplasmata archaeon]|jgi:hypothetical protein